MSIEKFKNFNKKMARPKFAKGGYVKRKRFAYGDIATNPTATPVGGPIQANTANAGPFGLTQALGLNAASANIQPGTNTNQLNNAYAGANNAINAQVGLTNTLAPQAATGVGAQNQVLQNQLDIARGAGPNPAQAQLAQATGTNVANEAALLAGQRGSNANVGLAGRNIGVAGANTMQGAAGQAATLGAEQQIAANNQAAGVAANQINQAQGATTNLNTAQQNEQNILQNANTAANNSAVGMQSNINDINAQNNRSVLGGITSGLGAIAGAFNEGGEVGPHHGKTKLDFIHKMTKMGMEHFDGGGMVDKITNYLSGNPPAANAAPAPTPEPIKTNMDPTKAQSVSDSFKGASGFAEGGAIQENPLLGNGVQPASQMPITGYTAPGSSAGPQIQNPTGQDVNLGDSFSSGYKATHKTKPDKQQVATNDFNQNMAGPSQQLEASNVGDFAAAHGGQIWNVHPSEHDKFLSTYFHQFFADGGKVPALVSPGEVYLNPEQVEQVKQGADPLRVGQRVPGQAKVKGDSYKNDFVKAELDEGGVVVDRENVDNPKKARKFVLKSVSKKHLKRPKR